MSDNKLGGKDLPNNKDTLGKFLYYNTENLNIKINDYFNFYDNRIIINEKTPEYLLIVTKLEQLFLSLFNYEFKDNKIFSSKEKRDFVVKLERTLFMNGRCAIVKWGNKIYPLPFSFEDYDVDIYNNPLKIKIDLSSSKKDSDGNKINNLIFTNTDKEKQFVIVNNNSLKHRTLFNLQDRIIELCKRILELDNASFLSRPHIFLLSEADDAVIRDINLAMNNEKDMIKKIPDEFKDMIFPFVGYDVTASRQEQVLFYLNFIFKLCGFSVNDLNNKKERQTEMEIKKSETFTGLHKDMLLERQYAFEEVEDVFNIKIDVTPDLDFMINEISKNIGGQEAQYTNSAITKTYGDR